MAVMDTDKVRAFVRFLDNTGNIAEAARMAGVSESWARKYVRGLRSTAKTPGTPSTPTELRQQIRDRIAHAEGLGRPLRRDEMCEEALQALDDFAFFRERYMGRVNDAWHADAAAQVEKALKDPNKSYIVLNCPPGVGKSAFANDLGCWLTVKNRRLRAVMGSSTFGNAKKSTQQLRRALERQYPVQPDTDDIDRGLAVEGQATLPGDFGLFKPIVNNDVWRQDEFVVVQNDGIPMADKEYTWSAVGMDSKFLGNRFNLILWDDVVDQDTIRTLDAIESQRAWWDDTAETRLEPGGLLVIIGQRFGANDLYRYCLDKKIPYDDDYLDSLTEEEIEALEADAEPMYSHIVYQAHAEDRCVGQHERSSPPYPDGCLLAPRRLPWNECRRIAKTKPRTWAIQYQQEDADPEDVLIPKIWVQGGRDPVTGVNYPGCWDRDRKIGEIPKGLVGPCYSLATVDPSPTKWWAIHWYLYYPQAYQLYLADILRVKMDGDGLLDWSNPTQRWTGVMLDWQERSMSSGAPITHWVVEANVAQRWLVRYEHVRRWQSRYKVKVIEHQTGIRKLDEELGISSIKTYWEHGQLRLPGGDEHSRLSALKLVNEVTRYPNATTDDQVMANWFAVYKLPEIVRPERKNLRAPRPDFVRSLPQLRSAG